MQTQLQKAIRIVQKTGDRLIVVNESNNESYVIMNLDEYERILKGCATRSDEISKNQDISVLTEEKLIDKINRDIALWKSQQSDENRINNSELNDEDDSYHDFDNGIEDNFFSNQVKKKKRWKIPRSIKQEAEEIVDEDTQYLERIPF